MSDFGGALRSLKEFPDYKMAVLGVPFDEKSSYLRGAAGGPAAIRKASTGKCYNEYSELGVNLAEETVLVDLGDVDVSGDADKTFAAIEKDVAAILAKGAVPIVLGGDHSITYPVLKAFGPRFKALDILHFDAHPDLYEDLYGDRLSHACPFARIMEDGLAQGPGPGRHPGRDARPQGPGDEARRPDDRDEGHRRPALPQVQEPALYLLRPRRPRPRLRAGRIAS